MLLVLISHAGWPFLKFGGIAGVTLFFVLSGYLITGILTHELNRTGRIEVGRFYRRRALRLLPALLLMLALYVPAALALGVRTSTVWRGATAAALYFYDVVAAFGWDAGPLGHTWSLSVEEQFYLLWPFLLLLLIRRVRRTTMVVLVALIGASLAVRCSYGWHDKAGYQMAYYFPWSNAFALLGGAALALSPRRPAPRHLAAVALTALLVIAGPMGLINGAHSGLNYGQRLLAGPLAAVCAVVLIWAVVDGQLGRWFAHPRLMFFGWLSYGLYLWHLPLDGLLGTVTPRGEIPDIARGTATALAAIGIALLSRGWWESRFLGEPCGIPAGIWRSTDDPSGRGLVRPRSAAGAPGPASRP